MGQPPAEVGPCSGVQASRAHGAGLSHATAGREAQFSIEMRDSFGNVCDRGAEEPVKVSSAVVRTLRSLPLFSLLDRPAAQQRKPCSAIVRLVLAPRRVVF